MKTSAQKADQTAEIVEILSSLEFFQEFSQIHLASLSEYAELRMFEPDSIVLQQDQANRELFFLVQGSLSVVVDGQEVARLQKVGDIIGEMSVISKKATSAEIRALEETRCLVIDGDDISSVAENRETLEAIIYRVYSLILTEKLNNTNQKAKRFEIAARDLEGAQVLLKEANRDLEQRIADRTLDLMTTNKQLEQQNVELTASHDRLKELQESRQFAFQSAERLYQVDLPKLEKGLQDVSRFLSGDIRKQILKVQGDVSSVAQMIRPMAEQALEDKAISSKRVLIVESNKKQQIIIKMALGGSGVNVHVASDVEAAKSLIGEISFDLALASVSNIEVLIAAREKHPDVKLVLLASTDIQEYLPLLEKYPQITNVVSRDEEDRSFTTKHVLSTVTKLLTGEVFGMEKYLAWGVEVFQRRIETSSMRRELIDDMCEKFKALGVRPSFLTSCSLVAEEMLMNAIYDAPVDADGVAKYNHLDRTQPIELERQEQGYFRVACDGNFLAVSTSDPFGALKKSDILKYLKSCYQGHAGVYNEKKGGAGRGLHQIVESSDIVIFNVKGGIRTEVISLFYLDQKSRGEKDSTSFHFFFD